MKTTIEKFKELFPDAEYDGGRNSINVYRPDGTLSVTLFHAKDLIDEYVGDNNTVESNELDPSKRTNIRVDAEDYILMNWGSYADCFKSI